MRFNFERHWDYFPQFNRDVLFVFYPCVYVNIYTSRTLSPTRFHVLSLRLCSAMLEGQINMCSSLRAARLKSNTTKQ